LEKSKKERKQQLPHPKPRRKPPLRIPRLKRPQFLLKKKRRRSIP